MAIMRYLVLAAVAAFAAGAFAKQSIPSAYDGYRDGSVVVGGVNYPLALHGIAIDWEASCRKRNNADCLRLAEALLVGLGDLAVDPIGATGTFQRACANGDGAACNRALDLFRSPSLVNHSKPEKVLETARRGCELKDGNSCGHLASLVHAGKGIAQDRERALALWDEHCSAAAPVACQLQADTLFFEANPASQAKAYAIYEENCRARSLGWACGGLAQATRDGAGVPADAAKALAHATKGCLETADSSPLACAIYGASAVRATNRETAGQAAQLLLGACLAGVGEACYHGGVAARNPPPGTKYAKWEIPLYFRQGCDLDHADSCYALANMYAPNAALTTDSPRLFALSDKACRLGSKDACELMAAFAQLGTDKELRADIPPIDPALPTALQLAKATQVVRDTRGQDINAVITVLRLNEEGHAEAAYIYGEWLNTGLPPHLAQNRADAMILYGNAAAQGHVQAAIEVGMAHWTGDQVKQDKDKAKHYLRIASRHGDEMAGAILTSMNNEAQRNAMLEYSRTFQARLNDMYKRAARNAAALSSAGSYSSGSGSTSGNRDAADAWRRYESRADQTNFNNRVNYITGKTSACPSSNPYC